MNKSIIIIVVILVLSCRSKNSKPEIEIRSSENIGAEKLPPIIYDTLVINENMKGTLLTEKFNSAQIKLKFYKNL